MGLVHEFEQLVNNCFKELPMSLQKPRILPHDVHYITRHDSFIVFPSLHFCEAEKIFDNGNKETLFGLFIHGSRD